MCKCSMVSFWEVAFILFLVDVFVGDFFVSLVLAFLLVVVGLFEGDG